MLLLVSCDVGDLRRDLRKKVGFIDILKEYKGEIILNILRYSSSNRRSLTCTTFVFLYITLQLKIESFI